MYTVGTDIDRNEFDPELYIQILIAITKSDRFNSSSEIQYVKKRADHLGVDMTTLWQTTNKNFSIRRLQVPRPVALAILRDAIQLASLDQNYSLQEKEKIYTYAEKMDIPRSDVRDLEQWIDESRSLTEKWNDLVSLQPA